MQAHAQHTRSPLPRPAFEVADIFRAHEAQFRATTALNGVQSKALSDILRCRTPALGGHLEQCPKCDFERVAYNSCSNRHCPKCQGLAQLQWLEGRMARVLPTHYFHVVFTLPAELRPLMSANRRVMFNVLFKAASQTLMTLGDDPERLGAQLGVTAVLHTWTRKLEFFPHLHCIVTGGGLTREAEPQWKPVKEHYLFPVQVMGALFRGKFLALMDKARQKEELVFEGGCEPVADKDRYAAFKDELYRTTWNTYAKRPFGGKEEVFRYLGRYTHRIGLSNHRLVLADDERVVFRTRGKDTITLTPVEFMRRFLNHVLPKGFVKIRHYGLHAGAVLARLEQARALLAPSDREPTEDEMDSEFVHWADWLKQYTGVDVDRCPQCGHTGLLRRRLKPWELGRVPP